MIEWLSGMDWRLTWFGYWCLGSIPVGLLLAPVLARRSQELAEGSDVPPTGGAE